MPPTNKVSQRVALSLKKYFNPESIFLQQVLIKEKVGKTEFKRLRTRNITDNSTSVDIHEFVKIGKQVIEVFRGIIYKEHFQSFLLKKSVENLFHTKLKRKRKIML